MPSHVTEIPAAEADVALRHFESMLTFETDCWDVHASLSAADNDFVLVDVRAPGLYAMGHVKGAINIPHGEITTERLAQYSADTLFVVYCAGPHCNGANKAAVLLSRIGFQVKMMIGGVTGWIDEGFTLTSSS